MIEPIQVVDLTCEYETQPLGLDIPQPRLSWQMTSTRRGLHQTAYQVLVAEDAAHLPTTERVAGPLLWDSGRTASAESHLIPYGGPLLRSGQRVWWCVRIWDEQDQPTPFSEPSWWEMGLLSPDDWHATWIGGHLAGSPRAGVPAPYLRQTFTLERPVASARLYITALGLFDAWINGQHVGEDVLAPGWTDYHQRVDIFTYDVTSLVQVGENALGAILGDGWYCGHIAAFGREHYGTHPWLLAQLHVMHPDGSATVIATGPDWLTHTSPIVVNDLFQGETYDARQELPGWNLADYDASAWQPAQTRPAPLTTLAARTTPPARCLHALAPIDAWEVMQAWFIKGQFYDFGQNIVGWVRLRVSGPAGATISIHHAEMLKPDRTLYTEGLRTAQATDHYTLRGEAEEIYAPRFTYHGFRYIAIDNPAGVTIHAVTGMVIYAAMPPTGSFACSNDLLNRLQENILWSQRGNFLTVPTDCPQRDERLGWTGDAAVFLATATFNMSIATFIAKWLRDLRDAQLPSSGVPLFAPRPSTISPYLPPRDGGPVWADAVILGPWTIYQHYGDQRLLQENYPAMKLFMNFIATTALGHIRCHPDVTYPEDGWPGFGDWLALDPQTPKDLIGTAFYAQNAAIMAQVATILGHSEDAQGYRDLHTAIVTAFQDRFLQPSGHLNAPTQTACALALAFHLVPELYISSVVQQLADDIQGRDNHLSTGFVGTPYLCQALSDNGQLDLAYALLEQTTYPAWLYPVTQGATTIWERWDAWTQEKGFQDPSMTSFNHYAYGAIGAWMYATIAGIQLMPGVPAFHQFLLRPRPGGSLTWARATLNSPYGTIASAWERAGDRFTWEITVPPGASALAHIPLSGTGTVHEQGKALEEAAGITLQARDAEQVICLVGSGTYRFEVG